MAIKLIRLTVISLMLITNSCAVNIFDGAKIDSSVTLCCPGNYQDYIEYDLSTDNMPAFLQDYVVAEFEAAFQEKGLIRNDSMSDLHVVLTYNHVNLDAEQYDIDPFIRLESSNVELRYIAVIEIAMFETATAKKVWGGDIRRIHHVTPGEYMHEDRARPDFLQAFRSVLSQYPAQ